jgi:predicted RecA/RadA family phage recombinase
MPATRVSEGHKIDYTPGADVAAGTVVLQGDLFGVAEIDLPANQLGALAVEGVFDITKATTGGTAFAAGADVVWDAGNSRATNTDGSGANKKIGNAAVAAADGDATVRVKLTPGAA